MTFVHHVVLCEIISFLASMPCLCPILFNSNSAVNPGLKNCFTSAIQLHGNQGHSTCLFTMKERSSKLNKYKPVLVIYFASRINS